MDYEVKLDIFEGPLDLLLYLIRKNEIDIYDIPIALITEQYLQHMEVLRSLNLDLAGEDLVLASTLIHIKSRLLLPNPVPDEEEEEDPRQELVQQLLAYQAYKEAALQLDGRPLLERDVFKRGGPGDPIAHQDAAMEEEVLLEASLFDLTAAFQRVASRIAFQPGMAIEAEKISLGQKREEIVPRLRREGSLTFSELLTGQTSRQQMLYAFLAILELVKMHLIRAYQSASFGVIRLFLCGEEEEIHG
jgi:segregation and condensation protein A